MTTKIEACAAYYRGLKDALTEHMMKTENDLRALPGISKTKMDEIVTSVHKKHLRLLSEIDRQFAEEAASDAQ